MCCLQETLSNYKETDRLNVKGGTAANHTPKIQLL